MGKKWQKRNAERAKIGKKWQEEVAKTGKK